MGLFTTTPVSLVDPTQQSAGTVNAKVDQFVSSAKGTDFSQHFELVGSATKSLQQQVNAVTQALRGDLPLPQDLGLTDPTGRVVAKFGFTADGAAQIYGLTVFDPLNDVAAFVGVQTELPLAITATTNASPDVITITGHGYSNGDTVLIQGATGDTAINGIRIVENITANTFTTTDLLGNPINGNGAYAGGGTATRYFGGGYFQTIGIGGTGPSTAKIRAYADGSVVINGATITLDTNGVTTTIGNLPAGSAGVAGVQVKNDTAPSVNVQMTDKGYYVRATDQAAYVVQINAPADAGNVFLRNIANDKSITIAASTPQITVATTAAGGDSVRLNSTSVQMVHGSSIGTLTYTNLNLADASNVVRVFLDASSSGQITLGTSGVAQTVATNASVTTTNALGTQSATLSSSGRVSGVSAGSITWSLGPALTINGNVVVDTSSNGTFLSVSVNGAASINSSGQAFVASLGLTSSSASITSAGVTTITSLFLNSAAASLTSGGVFTSISAGVSQSTVSPSIISTQNNAGTRIANLSSSGAVTGTGGGGVTWSLGGALILNSLQVVGQRQGAIAQLVGTAGPTYTATEEILINNLNITVNQLLTELGPSGHGLIG